MLCKLLLYNKVNKLHVYIYPHIPSLPFLYPGKDQFSRTCEQYWLINKQSIYGTRGLSKHCPPPFFWAFEIQSLFIEYPEAFLLYKAITKSGWALMEVDISYFQLQTNSHKLISQIYEGMAT